MTGSPKKPLKRFANIHLPKFKVRRYFVGHKINFIGKCRLKFFLYIPVQSLKFLTNTPNLAFSYWGPLKYYVIKEVGGWGQKMSIFDDLQYCKSSKRWVGLKKSKT